LTNVKSSWTIVNINAPTKWAPSNVFVYQVIKSTRQHPIYAWVSKKKAVKAVWTLSSPQKCTTLASF